MKDKHFHKIFTVDQLQTTVFAADQDSDTPRFLVEFGSGSGVKSSLHLTPNQASAIADALYDAADWLLGKQARKIAAEYEAEQLAREAEDDTADLPTLAELDAQTERVHGWITSAV